MGQTLQHHIWQDQVESQATFRCCHHGRVDLGKHRTFRRKWNQHDYQAAAGCKQSRLPAVPLLYGEQAAVQTARAFSWKGLRTDLAHGACLFCGLLAEHGRAQDAEHESQLRLVPGVQPDCQHLISAAILVVAATSDWSEGLDLQDRAVRACAC